MKGKDTLRILVVVLCLSSFLPTAHAQVYRQYDHRLTVVLPDDWECTGQGSKGFLAAFAAPDMRYSINTLTIFHQTLPSGMALDDFVTKTITSQEKLLWQYKLLNQQLVEHPFGAYHKLTFEWRPSWEEPLYVIQMIIRRQYDVYVLTTTAPALWQDHYQAVFERIFASFAFVN